MELNANEIIKALDYCANNEECVGVMCPYYATGCENCMPKDALSLIKELTEENERLHASCTKLAQKCASLTEENALLKHIELEAMRGEANNYKELYKKSSDENEKLSQSLANSKSILANSKADTVRKMHSEIKERCIKGGIYPAFVASTIDQIAKEMLNNE